MSSIVSNGVQFDYQLVIRSFYYYSSIAQVLEWTLFVLTDASKKASSIVVVCLSHANLSVSVLFCLLMWFLKLTQSIFVPLSLIGHTAALLLFIISFCKHDDAWLFL